MTPPATDRPVTPPAAALACPKHMTYGPCGGVRPDSTCEIGDRPCPFVDGPTVSWPAPNDARRPTALFTGTRPFLLADLPHVPLDAASVSRASAALAGEVDAVLFGDAGWARAQLPPAYRAMLVAREGLLPWAGLNCRDRNRVALEGELAALADAGAAVHCVTGDHTDTGERPDAQPVFDLDSTELASLAAAMGLVVSVAENPVAPPIEHRPTRLVEKARAGAHVCIINHAGSATVVDTFIRATRAAGALDLTFLVCVPLVASMAGLALLQTFTTLALPPGYLATIERANDPQAASVDEAVRYATDVLAIDGVVGIDLSSAIPLGDEDAAISAIVSVCRAIR